MTSPHLLQMSGIVVDLIYQIDQLPAKGADVRADRCVVAPGGGYNALLAALRAGLPVTYGGAHGTGPWSDLVRTQLERDQVEILQPQMPEMDQGSCVVLVDKQSERTFVSKEGADGHLRQANLQPVSAEHYSYALLSGYGLSFPNSQDALANWISGLPDNCCFIFDPSPAVARIPTNILRCALKRANWISANSAEAQFLSNCSSAQDAAQNLSAALEHGGGVIVRYGRDGCCISQSGAPAVHVAGFDVDTIDTNGAGDCHVGAFIAALARGVQPLQAANYANASAALSTTRFGPATSPTHSEIMSFLDRLTGTLHRSGKIGQSA